MDASVERRGTVAPGSIFHGDAFDLIQQLPQASVDLIVTSPPYWGHRTYGEQHNWGILADWEPENSRASQPSYDWYRSRGGILGLEPIPEWYTLHLCEFFDLARSKLKERGSLWVNLGDTYFARWSSIRDNGRQGLASKSRTRRRTPMRGYLQEKQLLLIPSRFAISMQDRRWILRNDLIWSKPNVPPRPEKDRLRLSHEHFFHFVKRPKEGRAAYFYDITNVEAGKRDVVSCNVKAGQAGHSATFPERIVEPRILSSCPMGGLVLDPFCGSGTVIRLAEKLGRRGLGFEICGKYING